mmetsp:Transcript_10498/g.24843  ORF Transcript_10498/g.24843 Transcript_10498/m.24843 type:complete len:207 (-) Transcript_10498:77-697(-)
MAAGRAPDRQSRAPACEPDGPCGQALCGSCLVLLSSSPSSSCSSQTRRDAHGDGPALWLSCPDEDPPSPRFGYVWRGGESHCSPLCRARELLTASSSLSRCRCVLFLSPTRTAHLLKAGTRFAVQAATSARSVVCSVVWVGKYFPSFKVDMYKFGVNNSRSLSIFWRLRIVNALSEEGECGFGLQSCVNKYMENAEMEILPQRKTR